RAQLCPHPVNVHSRRPRAPARRLGVHVMRCALQRRRPRCSSSSSCSGSRHIML
ncbi:hypothetical protein IWW50_004567, partial [Coemansia erecta]